MPDRHWHENQVRPGLRHPWLRARVRDGERLIGTFVKSRDPAVAEVIALGGYDFVVADLEHSPLTVLDVEGIVRACDCYDVPVIARLPATGLGQCGQLLDAGVTGIQVSDVTSAAAARAARAAAHYPPLGERGLSLATRAARFGSVPATRHIPSSLAQTVLIGQIESAEGLAALEEIIDSEVFDALFLGPTDLSVALRHAGQADHPDVAAALDAAASTITGRGTPLGIFCADVTQAQRWADRGLTLLVISTDLSMLAAAARATVGQLRTRQ
jgi:2-keto-3-deoxy-L-rhamnonate aldolase RhmA